MVKLQIQVIILIIGSATLVATNSVTSNEECPQICPLLLAPVCATNGRSLKEFDNQCELQWINCRLQRSTKQTLTYKEIAMDWCSTEFIENLSQKLSKLVLNKPECLKPCPLIYAPVCISDGKYRGLVSNKCEMELYNCAIDLTVDHFKVLQADTCGEPLLA